MSSFTDKSPVSHIEPTACSNAHRTNDVILVDPADPEYAVSFNPLACADPSRHYLLASGFVSSFKKIFDSWGPRLEDTLRNAAYVASEHGGSITTVMKLQLVGQDVDAREA